jgi:hypothetical protein
MSNNWPPYEKDIKNIAQQALEKYEDDKFKVLVYWDNPSIMIKNPFHFAPTDYVKKAYEFNERIVEVIIGKED